MNDDHARWRRLVLSLDDLEGEQQAAAQAHLRGCPECVVLLQRVREHERAPAQLGAWGAAAFGAADAAQAAAELSSRERAQAEASLTDLRARFQQHPEQQPRAVPSELPVRRSAPWHRMPAPARRWWVWAAPLVVAAAGIVMLVTPRNGSLVTGSLQVIAVGIDRAVDQAPRTQWRTGDAFALRFQLRRPAYPLVFHVDPNGAIALLYPADPGRLAQLPLRAGANVLPEPGTDERWVLSGEGGTETFLLVAPRTRPSALGGLIERLQRLPDPGASHADRTAALRRALEREFGRVTVAEARHGR
jgi:hypothetical protein